MWWSKSLIIFRCQCRLTYPLMNDLWILIGEVFVLIGLVTSESLLLIVGSLVVLIWLATKIWNLCVFRSVSH